MKKCSKRNCLSEVVVCKSIKEINCRMVMKVYYETRHDDRTFFSAVHRTHETS